MKNITRLLALLLVLSMVTVVFASCGKTISGKYQHDLRTVGTGVVTTYEFTGNKYKKTVETYALGTLTTSDVTEGTYEITETESGALQISFTEKDAESATTPVAFEETDDGIKIGLLSLKKV